MFAVCDALHDAQPVPGPHTRRDLQTSQVFQQTHRADRNADCQCAGCLTGNIHAGGVFTKQVKISEKSAQDRNQFRIGSALLYFKKYPPPIFEPKVHPPIFLDEI